MHYTPLDVHDIYPVDEELLNKRHCVNCNGKRLYVEQKDNGQYEVLQLLSTDPKDFMDAQFLPGNILS